MVAAAVAEGEGVVLGQAGQDGDVLLHVLQRLQHRPEARAELGEALERFEELGAQLWAARAREELERVCG